MSAMHHDTSPDLKVIGSKLNDILEVRIHFPCFLVLSIKSMCHTVLGYGKQAFSPLISLWNDHEKAHTFYDM